MNGSGNGNSVNEVGFSLSTDVTAKVYDVDRPIAENFDSYSEFSLYYFPNAMLFDRYFSIVLFIIGFPGNIISFLVWSNRRMYHGNSAAVYLAILSLNDTVVLAIALFRDLTKNFGVHYQPTVGSCETLEVINLTTQYASPLFVLAFTVERWLAICQPFLVSRICSVRRTLYICLGIFTLTLLVCCPQSYLVMTTQYGCETRTPYVFYFTTTLEIVYSLVAPLLVLTFNCLVINELAKIRRSQQKQMLRGSDAVTKESLVPTNCFSRLATRFTGSFQQADMRKARKRTEENADRPVTDASKGSARSRSLEESGGDADSPKFKSTTIMLLVVSFYVIFATLLGGIMYLLETKLTIDAYANWTMREFDSNPSANTALSIRRTKTILDEFCLSHFAMGFVLYYSTGQNFRDGVRRLLRRILFWMHHNICYCISKEGEGGIGHLRRKSSVYNLTLISSAPGNSPNGRPDEVHNPKHKLNASKRIGFPLARDKRRRRDEFPGLDTCGRRGLRQPSRLHVLNSRASLPSQI